MASNLGLVEEFDSELKLTEDKFSLIAQESQESQIRLDLSKRKFDNYMQSQPGKESNRAQSSVDLSLTQPALGGLETGRELSGNSRVIQADAPGVDLDASSGGFGDRASNVSSGAPEHLVLSDAAASDKNLNVPKTNDLRIQSLLHGHKWTTPTITYSFFSNANGGPYYSSKYKGIREITDKMKSYLRHILEEVIEPLVNVDFVEVKDTKNNYGQIRYMFSTSTSTASTTRLSSSSDTAGDIRFSPGLTKNFEEGPGAYRYETLIHETLHALGMKHPGNYNKGGGKQDPPFLPSKDDNSGNSVLSYNRLKELNPDKGAITPMSYDILALQYLYGAKAHEAGDTTYKFNSVYGYTVGNNFFGSKNREIKQTIWDSGGKDTFDFSGLAFNQSGYRLDLT
ncbi:MAG: M10 family metallopeptidase, partial [Pseudanabaenales cyanobacterium]|nr:M10 family metallopeptidase [Pseudanabaenales cyanobacterium]